MPLLKLDKASLHYGTQVLLDEVELSITNGDRLGLLGRNGAGKTTLLKILSGDLTPDGGERWLRPGVKLARLQQDLPAGDDSTVYDVVATGHNLDDEAAVAETGRRYRDTVLALGGSVPPMEVFEAFRGRAPSPEALLRHTGLQGA